MRFNYEFNAFLGQSLTQLMELLFVQNDAKMRNWYIILIDMIAMFLRDELLPQKVHSEIVAIEIKIDMIVSSIQFLSADDLTVETT